MYVKSLEADPESQATIVLLNTRILNAIILNDIADAEKTLETLRNKQTRRMTGCHFMNYAFALCEGLLCAILIRQKKGSRFLRKTLAENIAWFTSRTKLGNVNCVGMLQLLLAEKSSKKPGNEKRKQLYDKAISSLVRSGFTSFGALANELAGRFAQEGNDQYWTEHYLEEAANLYKEWGATRKVRMMLAEHKFLDEGKLAMDFKGVKSSTHKGRERFDSTKDGPKRIQSLMRH